MFTSTWTIDISAPQVSSYSTDKMSYLTAKWLLLAALLAQGRAIPMSHSECPHGDLIRIKNGDSLHLDCNSECSTNTQTEYKWMKVTGEQAKVPLELEKGAVASSLSIPSVTHSNGGQYACQCLPDGPECLYNVTVLPEMSFTASDSFIHYGESFDVTCIVRGYPSNFSTIKTVYGIDIPKQIRRQLNETTTRSYAAVMEAEEGEFMCTAEVYYQGELVDILEERVSVKVYEPPLIIYTTEFVLTSEEDLGKPGELTCTVQISPDVGTSVAWWVNGSQIEGGHSKYIMDVEKAQPNSDIRKYKLIISDLQLTDIGSYLCQLSSEYSVEDVQEAWIQVDYRERSKEQTEQLSKEKYSPESVPSRSARASESRSALFFVMCGVCVAACAVGVWQLTKLKKQRNVSPIIGYDHSSSQSHQDSHHKSFNIQSEGAYPNGTAISRRK